MITTPLCYVVRDEKIKNECCKHCPDHVYGDCLVPETYEFAYNEAIDNFVDLLKSDEFQKYTLDMVFETSRNLTYSQCISAMHEYIEEMAEKLRR